MNCPLCKGMKVKLSYRSLTTQATVIVKTKSAYSEHHLFQLFSHLVAGYGPKWPGHNIQLSG